MSLVDPDSLSATLDAVNEAQFFGRKLSAADRRQAAEFIASRHGLPGSYNGMFAPTQRDFREGAVVFTGERVKSGAGTAHVLSEEACRALIFLRPAAGLAGQALHRSQAIILQRLDRPENRSRGTYCCGTCSASLWRHLSAGVPGDHEAFLSAGLKTLKGERLSGGRWKRFPFHYTLLALVELDLPQALAEMRHAAPALERLMRRSGGDSPHAQRRRALAERVLARC